MELKTTIIKESAPHIRRKDNLVGMMLDVIIALLPLVIYGFVVFPVAMARNLFIIAAVMELSEFVFVLVTNRLPVDGTKHTFKEQFLNGCKAYHLSNALVPLVSAIILALLMPTNMDNEALLYVSLITSALFGIIIGKLVFGGTGTNIFNPAAVGFVFAKTCYGSHFQYFDAFNPNGATIVDAGATPLGSEHIAIAGNGGTSIQLGTYSLLDLFLGNVPGGIGEACKLLILVGLIYLIVRHTIDWRIPLAYLGAFFVMMLIAGFVLWFGYKIDDPWTFALYELLSGGVMFNAVYMATDPVTSPITHPGRVMFGIILAICTTFIRLFAAIPEGCVYSILIGNMLTSMIDYPKWATNKWNWKNIVWPIAVFVVFALIELWALCVEVF